MFSFIDFVFHIFCNNTLIFVYELWINTVSIIITGIIFVLSVCFVSIFIVCKEFYFISFYFFILKVIILITIKRLSSWYVYHHLLFILLKEIPQSKILTKCNK